MTSTTTNLVIILQIAGDLLDLVGDGAFETVQDLILVRDVHLIM